MRWQSREAVVPSEKLSRGNKRRSDKRRNGLDRMQPVPMARVGRLARTPASVHRGRVQTEAGQNGRGLPSVRIIHCCKRKHRLVHITNDAAIHDALMFIVNQTWTPSRLYCVLFLWVAY
jgi:hypothetical protein